MPTGPLARLANDRPAQPDSTRTATRAVAILVIVTSSPGGLPAADSGALLLLAEHDDWLLLLLDDVLGDDDLLDVPAARHVVHDVEHRPLGGGAQAAGAGLVLHGRARDGLERAVGELEAHPVHLEELPVLLHERVARLGEDL